jgi:hypothetical protein
VEALTSNGSIISFGCNIDIANPADKLQLMMMAIDMTDEDVQAELLQMRSWVLPYPVDKVYRFALQPSTVGDVFQAFAKFLSTNI